MASPISTTSPLLVFLLATVLKSTVLLLAAAMVCRLLRAAAHRHLVWVLTFVALLALPLASLLLPPLPVLPLPAGTQASVLPAAFAQEGMVTPPATTPSPARTSPASLQAHQEQAITNEGMHAAPTTAIRTASPLKLSATPRSEAGPATASRHVVPAPTRTTLPAKSSSFDRAAVAFFIWLVGMAMLLLLDLRDRLARRRLARTARPLTAPPWGTLLAELSQVLGLRRVPQLLTSAAAAIPMTWGVMRPVVLLPAAAEGWPEARRRTVLLHELAHVARRDALGLGLARAARLLYWLNPLVWWAQRRLQLESEHAADDRVLQLGTKPSSYADHLLAVARTLHRPVPGGALAMARPSQLPGRIRAILDSSRARTPLTSSRLLAASAAAALLVVTVAAAAPRAPEPPAAPTAPAPPTLAAEPTHAPLPPAPPEAPAPVLAPPTQSELTPQAPLPPNPPLAPRPVDRALPAPSAPLPPTPTLAPWPAEEALPALDAPLPPAPALAPLSAEETLPVPEAPLAPAPALAPWSRDKALPTPDAPLPRTAPLAPRPADAARPVPPAGPRPERSSPPRATPAPETPPTPAVRPTLAPGGTHPLEPRPVAQIAEARPGALLPALGAALTTASSRDAAALLCPDTFEDGSVSAQITDHRYDLKARKGSCQLEVEIVGEVELLPDDSGIGELSRGARMMIEERRGGARRQLEVEPNASGLPVYSWRVDGRDQPFGADGKAWLQAMLPTLARVTGLNAEARVAHIYAARGTNGVLQEIALVRGDFTQRKYFHALFDQPGLSPADLARAIGRAGEEIGSDFELAELLIGNRQRFLDRPATQQAYLEAARSIGSDFEMRRTLAAALDESDLTAAARDALLATAQDIGSDFEAAELLIGFVKTQATRGPLPTAFFETVATIGSDFEMRRTLEAVVARQELDDQTTLALLRAARDIGSDFELAELLVHLVERHPLDAGQRAQLETTATDIGSDFESGRVYTALARRSGR